MTIIVLTALLLSSVFYIGIGLVLGKHNKSLGDLFPILRNRNARVETSAEFSKSTVATTVSLATIVLAYFELAGYFGLYLLWTAVTTAIGMLLLKLFINRIWEKLNKFDHRPTMHEFLGREYNSPSMAFIASLCTSLGFLLIYATELIVGSKFLAGLVPQIPEWITVVFLSLVGFGYTMIGGFRAVIKTDQWQMVFIWFLIISLGGYYIYHLIQAPDISAEFAKAPKGVFDLTYRPGLVYFLFGIAIMNIPTHIANMSVWQRISGAQNPETVAEGVKKSVWEVFFSWSLISLLACFAYLIVTPANNQSLLMELLTVLSNNLIGKIILFIVVLGLFGAMLSTASTNLLVVSHTLSEDVFSKLKNKTVIERADSKRELIKSRILLVVSALLAVFLVEGLKYFDFSIADLVFAIYGGSLSLFPPILFALLLNENKLKTLSAFAKHSVILGFVCGWGAAIYGKIIGDGNLIFLSPCLSIAASALVLGIGYWLKRNK